MLTVGLVLAAPVAASAAPPETTPPTTPAQSGGGCAANGAVIAGAARGEEPFGETVRENTPIAPLNAAFFRMFCTEAED
ncbi:hypothetical protein SAMN04488107_2507 [Geodermatophilus saharensis]|uniref:Uncharacterized protein n=1 Tax=Geodermatophilus saharensis TaxID=1137994 RepID=A0A239EDC2_9ACTN|nr:hypothetical protein SAMN04488107_2507 [Geodermatophilus saharensis]